MLSATALAHPLPRALPEGDAARLFLLAVRRMGSHGLDDAHVAGAFMTTFGAGFRRPLMAMRVMMNELAATSSAPITIAPCCCARMTGAEAALIDIISQIAHQPRTAHLLLADLLGNRRVDGVLATMALVGSAFSDVGRPLDQLAG